MSSLSKDKKLTGFVVIFIFTLFSVICPFLRLNLHALFALSFSKTITTNHDNFLSFDNDDMKPSKRQVSFVSLILVLKCS